MIPYRRTTAALNDCMDCVQLDYGQDPSNIQFTARDPKSVKAELETVGPARSQQERISLGHTSIQDNSLPPTVDNPGSSTPSTWPPVATDAPWLRETRYIPWRTSALGHQLLECNSRKDIAFLKANHTTAVPTSRKQDETAEHYALGFATCPGSRGGRTLVYVYKRFT